MTPPLWPLKTALRLLPDALHGAAGSRLFNHLIQGQGVSRRLAGLEGKRIHLRVEDAGATIPFVVCEGRLARDEGARSEPADVTISGRLEDFIALASRQEDPDTLFFARRLAMEGNTEDGLYVKNLLDAFDFDLEAHLRAVVGDPLVARLARLIQASPLGRLPFLGRPPLGE